MPIKRGAVVEFVEELPTTHALSARRRVSLGRFTPRWHRGRTCP